MHEVSCPMFLRERLLCRSGGRRWREGTKRDLQPTAAQVQSGYRPRTKLPGKVIIRVWVQGHFPKGQRKDVGMRRGRHPRCPGFLAEMDDESFTQPNVWEDEAAPVKERVKNLAHIRNLRAQR